MHPSPQPDTLPPIPAYKPQKRGPTFAEQIHGLEEPYCFGHFDPVTSTCLVVCTWAISCCPVMLAALAYTTEAGHV